MILVRLYQMNNYINNNENILIYDILYQTLPFYRKPLIKYMELLKLLKYQVSKYLIQKKAGITDSANHNFAATIIDSYNLLTIPVNTFRKK